MKLTKEEQNEPMYVTWGRILTDCRGIGIASKDFERLKLLTEKFNKDMAQARIEEKYFK